MNKYLPHKSNYDKTPSIKTGFPMAASGSWENIAAKIKEHIGRLDKQSVKVVIECYQGVLDEDVLNSLQIHLPGNYILSRNYYLPEQFIDDLVHPDVTDDPVLGYVSRLTIDRFFDPGKLAKATDHLSGTDGITVIYGCGASYICQDPDLIVYIDMARWEIQQRFRKNLVANIGSSRMDASTSDQYRRAFYVDWRVCDRIKKKILPRADYILDTHVVGNPKMISGTDFQKALDKAVSQPFRVVPFFDPGPWGGQWMKECCDLDRSVPNYAWCFDCVPEENSLFFTFDSGIFETPSVNLVYFRSKLLLGDPVQSRFGDEFPIRFDFLDTMDGGNLSLQVHPTTEYAQENFGIHYTQDESYYILDAGEDACVYLGLKEDADVKTMFDELVQAQQSTQPFDAGKHVNRWPVKKHDHLLIPAGTIHCSGKNSMVLEISATPFNFTFKLWDWDRLGLDGRPRPIHIRHGREVIDESRRTAWVNKNLINQVETLETGNGWKEERTGLHKREFIETRRHYFKDKLLHRTRDSVEVLNLVEGREITVESPKDLFEPFVVHYAETFIVPASIREYTVRPSGESEGSECMTIKAFVRTKA